MGILEIIDKKREGKELTREEINYAFNGYFNGVIEDYQMSSLLMAICIQGMSERETIDLTDLMLNSGTSLDTSKIEGVQVDKHSTGGVGDKTTLIIGPIMAALGYKMGKLSGRSLGFTGGTIDKLESIPGFRVSFTGDEFINNLNKVGFALMMQTPDMTPLDKVIYDLRDVSGTVSSVPLIASSIMSKKLAVGSKYILIDLKVGDGALIKNKSDAVDLANLMIQIGKAYDREVIPVLTDMNIPLGDNVGNSLEVLEAFDVLKGKNGVLRDLCIELASVLYSRVERVNIDVARRKVESVLTSGEAYKKFVEFVNNQGGNLDAIKLAKNRIPIYADREGILKTIKASNIGYLSKELGAGRKKKNDLIDYGVGVVINKHIGDYIQKGDILCYLYQNDTVNHTDAALQAFVIEN